MTEFTVGSTVWTVTAGAGATDGVLNPMEGVVVAKNVNEAMGVGGHVAREVSYTVRVGNRRLPRAADRVFATEAAAREDQVRRSKG